MKKGSFKGLLCREFYLIKPAIPAMLIGTLSITVLSVLVVLSFRFGKPIHPRYETLQTSILRCIQKKQISKFKWKSVFCVGNK